MVNKKKINTEVWDLLKEDERAAITLSLGHGKSTWESGEILSKAHFKYLEIQKRARKFMEIFTNHFDKYNGLFPEDIYISFPFKEYLTCTMIERKNISDTIRDMEDPSYSLASRRKKLIEIEINRLLETDTESAKDLYHLIMDFDRWNNFRILPPQIQEPSAFKRRNKARYLKQVKRLISLPQFSIIKIISNFSYNGKYEKLYLPVISPFLDNDFKVISIKKEAGVIETINKIGLFIFDDRAIAEEFSVLVAGYFINSVRNCKTGQKFWPEFRVIITKASNYKELQNINRSQAHLDTALFDLDRRKVQKRKEKPEPGEERASDEDLFYSGGKI